METTSPATHDGPRAARTAAPAALIGVLGALTAVAPLATDMYVPGFPQMGDSLHASSSAVQLTMTAFLAGLVLGQIVIGPLSDSLGRRGLLLGGAAGFVLMSAACAVSPGVEVLTAARFLQGVCGAAGMVLARAVITDRFHGAEIPRLFALLAQILGVAPVTAPVLGGAILAVSTWRTIFAVLAVIGVALLAAVVLRVPESLPPERRHPGGLPGALRAMGRMSADRAFLGYALVLAFTSAALFVYIAGSSFVFEDIHGTSATVYSLIFASNALGVSFASAVFGRLAGRMPLNRLLTIGVGITLAGALAQLLCRLAVGESFALTWLTLFVMLSGVGFVFPAAMSIGQVLGRAAPGAASALLGGMQFLFGAIAAPVVGLFGTGSSLPMTTIILVSLAAAAVALLALARPWLHQGEALPRT